MNMRMVVAAAVLAAGLAAQAASLKEGTKEFNVSGLFDPTTASGTEFQMKLGCGYFVQDNIEIGGRIGYENNNDVTQFNAGPFAEMDFDLGSEVVPFVGAELDFAYANTTAGDSGALALTGYGGAKYFLSETVALGARLELSAATDKIYPKKDGADSTDVRIEFGMSFYFP